MHLRELIAGEGCLLAPGVYDCLTAKLVAEAGFEALSISGYSVEAARYGLPDLGFTGLADMAAIARQITDAVALPALCDADTGYGGPANVYETVRRLDRSGVHGLHVEDQVLPKKCGGLVGRSVVSVEEMTAKIRAALSGREDGRFVIVARTDAKDVHGIEEAARRLNAYLQAGADIAFAAENYTPDELRRLSELVRGPLAICGGVPGWSGSFETRETYASLGIRLVIYPFSSLFPAAHAMRAFYAEMKTAGGVTQDMARTQMVGFDWFSRFIGVDVWEERASAALAGK